MVSLAELVARRLIIIIVATGTVSVIGGTVIGRYAIPSQKSHSSDGAAVTAGGTAATPSPGPTPAAGSTALVPATPEPSDKPAAATEGSSVPGVPTRINELGIPVGYPHTEAGAISACANYVSAFENVANRDPSRIEKIFRSIANDAVAKRLSDRLIEVDKQTAKNFAVSSINSPKFRLKYRPLGFKIAISGTDQTKIYIWSSAIVGVIGNEAEYKVHELWGTDLCTVSWDGTDWKLADADDGPDGPAPTEQGSDEYRDFLLIGLTA